MRLPTVVFYGSRFGKRDARLMCLWLRLLVSGR